MPTCLPGQGGSQKRMWLLLGVTNRAYVDPPLLKVFVFSGSTIDRETIQAYLETHYCVQTEPVIVLRVDEPCPDLAVAHDRRNADCSAFLTAWNPLSQVLSGSENASRHVALTNELEHRSLEYVDVVSHHPSNGWPDEPGVLVFGLSLEAAKALGTRYEQNAIVWNGLDAVPRLVLLR